MTPSEFREDLDIHKTRMNGVSCGEESMTICSAVLIQCQRVTDRQTDVQPISITCFSIADARKNEWSLGMSRIVLNKTVERHVYLMCRAIMLTGQNCFTRH